VDHGGLHERERALADREGVSGLDAVVAEVSIVCREATDALRRGGIDLDVRESCLMTGVEPEWSISTWLQMRTSIFDGSITVEMREMSSSLNVILAVSMSVTFSSMIR
jgi:hypothetical protein